VLRPVRLIHKGAAELRASLERGPKCRSSRHPRYRWHAGHCIEGYTNICATGVGLAFHSVGSVRHLHLASFRLIYARGRCAEAPHRERPRMGCPSRKAHRERIKVRGFERV